MSSTAKIFLTASYPFEGARAAYSQESGISDVIYGQMGNYTLLGAFALD